MAQQLAHVPIAAASLAQDAEPRPLEVRKGGKLFAYDKIEYCPTPHTAAYDLEAGPVCHGRQPWGCAQFTDKKPSRIELGSNFRAAENNRSGPTPKKPAGNPPPRAYNALASLRRLLGI